MTATIGGLLEVGPFVEYWCDQCRATESDYRRCLLCDEGAQHDYMDGKQPRAFYRDPEREQDVCERCVGEYLADLNG